MKVIMSRAKNNGISPDNIREWLSFEASDGEIFRDSNLFNHDSELKFAAPSDSDLNSSKKHFFKIKNRKKSYTSQNVR